MPAPSTPEQHAEWDEWLTKRPPAVRAVVEAYPPWPLYRLTESGQLATISAYDEHDDGRVTVSIFAWRDWLGPYLGHGVFGIDPEDLERVNDGDEGGSDGEGTE